MKRPRANSIGSIALFPFLAVLLCTMGGLIVLLVVLARQARLEASGSALQARQQTLQLDDQRRRLAEQIAAIESALYETAESVESLQAHLDQQQRQLQDVWAQHAAAQAELRRLPGSMPSAEATRLRQELDWYGRSLHELEEKLQRARRNAREQQESYAIVPYVGPNGTNRRPIYIECRADKVVLLPEGVELTDRDFIYPGPQCPLIAALRATAAYRPAAGEAAPYPLLLVRPDGIEAYYAALEAISTTGWSYGYEFIDGDWKLALPAPDPKLAQAQARAIDNARLAAARLAATRPGGYGKTKAPTFRASPTGGGLVAVDGSGDDDDDPRIGAYARNQHDLDSRSNRHDDLAASRAAALGDGNLGAIPPAPPRSIRSGPAAGSSAGSSPFRGGSADKQNPLGSMFASGGASRAIPLNSGTPGSELTIPSDQSSSPGQGTGSTESGIIARSREPLAPRGTPGGEAASRAALPPRSSASTADSSELASAGGGAGGPSSAGSRGGGSGAAGFSGRSAPSAASGDMADVQDAPPVDLEPLARRRGKNWALPKGAERSVPITREITVVVSANTLAVMSDDPWAPPRKVIPLTRSTADALDEFRSTLCSVMEDWGIAGRGMHWRPLLRVEVTPGGQDRYVELEALLRDSGIILKRKA
jgi:hypothetical protein